MPEFRPGRADAAEPSKTIAASGIAISTPDFRKAAQAEAPPLPVDRPAVVPEEVREPVPEAPAQTANAERLPKERPRRKLIEERPAMPNLQPGARFPWGMVAAGLLVVALLLAFLSYRPHRQNAAPEVEKPRPQTQIAAAAPAADKSSERSNASTVAATPAAGSSPVATHSAPSNSTSISSSTSTSPSSPASSLVSPASAGKPPQPSSTPPESHQLSAASPSQPTPPTKASSTPPAGSARKEASLKDAARAAGATPPARTKPAATFTLLIRAEETSWVSIAADGKPVAHETLIAPAGTSVRATQEIVVRAGNAAGLVFVLNGKTLPKQGEPGEVKTLVFDSQGVRVEKADDAPPVAH